MLANIQILMEKLITLSVLLCLFTASDVIKYVFSGRARRGLRCSFGGRIHVVTSQRPIPPDKGHVRRDGSICFLGCLHHPGGIAFHVRGRNSVLHAIRSIHVLYNRIFSDFFLGSFYAARWLHWSTERHR